MLQELNFNVYFSLNFQMITFLVIASILSSGCDCKGFGGYVGSDSMGGVKDDSSFGYGNLKDISYKSKHKAEKQNKEVKSSEDDALFSIGQFLASSGSNGDLIFGQRLATKEGSSRSKSGGKPSQRKFKDRHQSRGKSPHGNTRQNSAVFGNRGQRSSGYEDPSSTLLGFGQVIRKPGYVQRQGKNSAFGQNRGRCVGCIQRQGSSRNTQHQRGSSENRLQTGSLAYREEQGRSSGYDQQPMKLDCGQQSGSSGHGHHKESSLTLGQRQRRYFTSGGQTDTQRSSFNRQQYSTNGDLQENYRVRYSIDLGPDSPSANWWVQQDPNSSEYDLRLQHGNGGSSNVYFNLYNDH